MGAVKLLEHKHQNMHWLLASMRMDAPMYNQSRTCLHSCALFPRKFLAL